MGHTARIRQIALGDVDADGDLDMFAPDAQGDADALFINDGTGVFVDEGAARIGTSSQAGATRFGDFDADGDLDLFIADGYGQRRRRECIRACLSHTMERAISPKLRTRFPEVSAASISMMLKLEMWTGTSISIFWPTHTPGTPPCGSTTGAGMFADASDGIDEMDGSFHYNAALCDVDGDDDLDLWTENVMPDFTEQLQINDGSGVFTDETVARVTRKCRR